MTSYSFACWTPLRRWKILCCLSSGNWIFNFKLKCKIPALTFCYKIFCLLQFSFSFFFQAKNKWSNDETTNGHSWLMLFGRFFVAHPIIIFTPWPWIPQSNTTTHTLGLPQSNQNRYMPPSYGQFKHNATNGREIFKPIYWQVLEDYQSFIISISTPPG